jgi:hypothetical protein
MESDPITPQRKDRRPGGQRKVEKVAGTPDVLMVLSSIELSLSITTVTTIHACFPEHSCV